MIEKFKWQPTRDAGVVYKSYYEKAKMMYEMDPMKGGEVAMSILEQIITGKMSTDDVMIQMSLTEVAQTSDKKAKDFEKKMEAQREARIQKLQLRRIAELYTDGRTQKEMGEIIGVTQQVISNRIATIKKEFPELLEEAPVREEFLPVPTGGYVF